jgi:NAD(P)-dependent dehydrogenase (short-subunit alcohol dehydrogenase family)
VIPPSRGSLSGRTVLVTGGSRGIGAATVRALHADGAHVVLHFGSGEAAARAAAADLGDRVSLVQGDLSAPGAGDAVWAAAVGAAGRVDVLVNNAGAWLASPLDDAGAWAAGWDANLALNLRAAADLCRCAVLHFRSTGGGVVVNVASRSSHRGDDAEHLAYGAAKGGLLALTKGIARGYAGENVLAYAVAPGWVATDIAVSAGPELAARAAGLPLGEITPPEEVAAVIAFLASGRARHTTGATIDITGADYVR